jgi:molybdopterin/thiamine biosynthesis adenylyltransferase
MHKRYERQIRCASWGEIGQSKVASTHVAVVGCGALGTVQAETLARAGVGRIVLIDRDFVEESNLHRQFLFSERDALEGMPKAAAAVRRLGEINSTVEYRAAVADLDSGSVRELLDGADLVLDGTDNFETRYLINDYCVQAGVPWIYGAAVGTYGITMTILPGETACLRCVYPEPPAGAQPTCETAGVLGSITMFIAAIQAAEALKVLSGNLAMVRRTILSADIWTGRIRETNAPGRDPECPACGRREFEWLDGARRAPVSLCGRNAVQIHDRTRPLDLRDLRERLAQLGEVRANDFALRFFREPYELTVFPDGRAIVKGTTDPAIARSVYSRYIGN